MTAPNRCQFWDCTEIINRAYFLCSKHNFYYRQGAVDPCPGCGSYKSASYEACRNCTTWARTAGAR